MMSEHLRSMPTSPPPRLLLPRMVARSGCFSPSAEKPARVVESWLRLGVSLELCDVEPVTIDELSQAHEASYVAESSPVNARTASATARPSRSSLIYTSGAMLGAARRARRAAGRDGVHRLRDMACR